ncbi:MAG: LamB/YcsF family protein [Ruminococcaceae bacterium]|nr:LamB/YcsF family protein [Oscillospiraceae bacterium]
MYAVDLNSDLGESFGAYTIGRDGEILPLVSSANVACGFHAGDPTIMAKTTKICKESGTAIGAHPGFADLQGFGRRNMSLSPEDARNLVVYQVGALDAFCKSAGLVLQHVKPHGALYNMAAKDGALSKAICEGIYAYNPELILLGLANSEMLRAAKEIGLPYAAEVFADRAYEDDGTLVARTKPGAMIHDEDEAVSRVIGMIKNRTVKTISGREIEICADSVCVHGDSEKALLFVKKIRTALQAEGIIIKPIAEIVKERV